MIRLSFGRHALGVGLASVLLTGCGGQSATTSAMPQGSAAQARAHQASGSYGDLVYVATSNAIVVLTYPQLEIVQSLPSPYAYSGICSDPNNGNVYVAAGSEVIVYAHGGTSPIATLTPPSGYHSLVSCAVDPTTDNLIVTSQLPGYTKAALLLYPGGQGNATIIATKQLDWYWYPTYDDKGNLFATCWTKHGHFHLDELPAGKTRFVSIKVVLGFSVYKVQWDGAYIAFQEFYGNGVSKVFQLQISGDVGNIVGSETYARIGMSSNFWIHNGVLFNALGKIKKNRGGIGVWSYPSGGDPTAKRFGVTKGANDKITDITVSVSPSHSRIRH
jgi:hypothetical protein